MWNRPLFASVLLLFLTLGCFKPGEPDLYPDVLAGVAANQGSILFVPFVEQAWKTCGPTALTEYLLYYGIEASSDGIPVTHDNVANDMHGWDGATDDEMLATAYKFGLAVHHYSYDTDDMYEEQTRLYGLIDGGFPVVLTVRHSTGTPGYSRNHYMLLVGYSGGILIVHNGSEAYMPLSMETYWEMHVKHPGHSVFTFRKRN